MKPHLSGEPLCVQSSDMTPFSVELSSFPFAVKSHESSHRFSLMSHGFILHYWTFSVYKMLPEDF